MKIINNLTPYTPTPEKLEALGITSDALFLQSDSNEDWYESQSLFSRETTKIAYDVQNIIRSISTDVSTLWPIGMSVAELAPENIPEGMDISGAWQYINGRVISRVYSRFELVDKAKNKRRELISLATKEIDPLIDAELLGDITESETIRLLALRQYRVSLSRLDLSTPDDIIWPTPPLF